MKIIIERNIPYIAGALERHGEVAYLPAGEITREAVADADALFVRTRTRCNADLLEGSRVRFIATATIGTDHIDLDYCRSRGITVVNAPGCNAPAVAQYVFAVIGSRFAGEDLSKLRLGVVGVGNVGSIVARWGERLGMTVLRCDPPRMRREGGDFVDLRCIAEHTDIITFHTPLNLSGIDATYHLADAKLLGGLSRCRLLINSSRGEVVDNAALAEAIGKTVESAAIDCWEGEPAIDRNLLAKAFVATPHIAGYSSEGKKRATAMTLEAFARHFGVDVDAIPTIEAPARGADIDSIEQVTATYNPLVDTELLRTSPDQFENLRNNYNLRHEVVTAGNKK
ncbi:MAG: 4-phosphoerythronate dehydrogenase [Bacteroidales bacterium]|nr:4-phosphoerythronate dehydrogenase [Bacteroidales bacterium]